MARKSDLQRNIEGAKSRLESAKEGKYYDVASKTVKTHKDEKKKKKTIKTAEASLKSYDARNRSQTYREGGKVDVTDVVKDVETLEALEWGYKKLPKKPKGELMSAKDFLGRKIVDTKVGIEKKKKKILKGKK